jgi:hypothetical protein
MGIFLKYISIFFVWVGLFSLSYLLMNSQAEEEVIRLQKILSSAQNSKSYATAQTILLDDKEQMNLQSISQQDPNLLWVTSKSKLTDTEDFKFEVYFQPDMIYIHSLTTNLWNKADHTDPVAGQLDGLKDPLALWLRLLKHAERLERSTKDHKEYFIVHLQPFKDEIYGVLLEDIEGGTMEIETKNQPYEIEKMKLDIRLKPNIFRGYNQITYLLRFSDQDKTAKIWLPKEAETAKKID